MAGSAFGFGTPTAYIAPLPNPWSLSTSGAQGFGGNQYGLQPLQQILQGLQFVPQQVQHLQQLEVAQQQLLQQLQQLVQIIPAQLAQLQQLIQIVPQQIQQLQQPFGQGLGGGFAVTAPWALSPQVFGAQPGHVM